MPTVMTKVMQPPSQLISGMDCTKEYSALLNNAPAFDDMVMQMLRVLLKIEKILSQ